MPKYLQGIYEYSATLARPVNKDTPSHVDIAVDMHGSVRLNDYAWPAK
jgi:hypothetical protein